MDKVRKNIILTGTNVVLRSYCEADFGSTYAAVMESIPEISRWMPWCHEAYGLEDHKKWSNTRQKQWDGGVEYDFVIFRPESSKALGICGLNNFDWQNRRANLGYWVRTSQTGKGLATEAARLLAGFGFETLHLNRIEILIAQANTASQRVAEKLGVAREGFLKNRLIVQNKVHHAFLYAWVKSDRVKKGKGSGMLPGFF
jgi:RimJ/RimL family protein N-acetyltransferase